MSRRWKIGEKTTKTYNQPRIFDIQIIGVPESKH